MLNGLMCFGSALLAQTPIEKAQAALAEEFDNMPKNIKAAAKKLFPKAPPYYDMALSLQTIEAQKFLIGFENKSEMITLTFDENAKLLDKHTHPIDEDFD